jgi:hypothetical protein
MAAAVEPIIDGPRGGGNLASVAAGQSCSSLGWPTGIYLVYILVYVVCIYLLIGQFGRLPTWRCATMTLGSCVNSFGRPPARDPSAAPTTAPTAPTTGFLAEGAFRGAAFTPCLGRGGIFLKWARDSRVSSRRPHLGGQQTPPRSPFRRFIPIMNICDSDCENWNQNLNFVFATSDIDCSYVT